MIRKLNKTISEIEKTKSRIAELQASLKEMERNLAADEEAEMIKTFRGLKLSAFDLMNLLEGLQNGTMTIQQINGVPQKEKEISQPHNDTVLEDVPEREDIEDDDEEIG